MVLGLPESIPKVMQTLILSSAEPLDKRGDRAQHTPNLLESPQPFDGESGG
jgi:hypothetical protein